MAQYAISFRIDTGNHAYTYAERYSSFMEQVRKTGAWEETTSFALTTSVESLEQIADRLYYQSKFEASYDLMLVIDVNRGVAVSRGPVAYPATLTSKLNRLIQK